METIREINTKVWYRALKVVFTVCYAFALLAAGMIVFEETSPYEMYSYDRSYIQCADGSTFNLAERGIYHVPGNNTALSKEDSAVAVGLCSSLNGTAAIPSPDFTNYTVVPVKTSFNNYSFLERLWYGALAMGAVVMVFEAIRHVFYYIALGKLFPTQSGKDR